LFNCIDCEATITDIGHIEEIITSEGCKQIKKIGLDGNGIQLVLWDEDARNVVIPALGTQVIIRSATVKEFEGIKQLQYNIGCAIWVTKKFKTFNFSILKTQ